MIRDLAEFRRTGVASRRVAELDIPVEVWRTAMCQAAHRHGARVRTFVIPPTETREDDPHVGGMVFALRVDPPPDRVVAGQGGHVRWWHVEELGMPVDRRRTALHRTARRDHARVRTFLVSPRHTDRDAPDQLVFLVWVDAELTLPAPATTPPSGRASRQVTQLIRDAAARHPSAAGRCDVDGER